MVPIYERTANKTCFEGVTISIQLILMRIIYRGYFYTNKIINYNELLLLFLILYHHL
jgi:hypothetical protein